MNKELIDIIKISDEKERLQKYVEYRNEVLLDSLKDKLIGIEKSKLEDLERFFIKDEYGFLIPCIYYK